LYVFIDQTVAKNSWPKEHDAFAACIANTVVHNSV